MKKFLFFLMGVFTLIITACSSDDIEPQLPEAADITLPRPGTGQISLPINRTLLTNWEKCNTVTLLGPQGTEINVAVPWSSVSESLLDGEFANDIKAEDGWIMLFHTFRTLSTDPNLNYMCFYNRFSGVIKFFYYAHQQDTGTHTVWEIKSELAKIVQPLFSYYDSFSNPVNGSTPYSIYSLTLENESNSSSTLSKGWNGFQFQLTGYRPSMTTGRIQIGAYNTVYTNYTFNGQTESKTSGKITTRNGATNALDNGIVSNAVLTTVGNNTVNKIKELTSSLPKTKFLGLDLVDVAGNIATGNIVGAITSGLGSIFKFLVKPTQTVSDVSLTTNGTITLGGESETYVVSTVSPMVFNLDSILSANFSTTGNTIASIATSRKSKVELGVWNLKNTPKYVYCPYTEINNYIGIPSQNQDISFFDINGIITQPEPSVSGVTIEFNPEIQPYIKSYSVKTVLLDVEGGNRSTKTNRKKIDVEKNDRGFLSKQENLSVYGIFENQTQPFRGLVFEVPYGTELNDNTKLYYDWGNNAIGNRALAVILTWVVEYNGKETEYTESRYYEVAPQVTYYPFNSSVVNNPPESFLIQDTNFTLMTIDPLPDEKM